MAWDIWFWLWFLIVQLRFPLHASCITWHWHWQCVGAIFFSEFLRRHKRDSDTPRALNGNSELNDTCSKREKILKTVSVICWCSWGKVRHFCEFEGLRRVVHRVVTHVTMDPGQTSLEPCWALIWQWLVINLSTHLLGIQQLYSYARCYCPSTELTHIVEVRHT